MFIDINKIGPDGVRVDADLDLPELQGSSGEPLPVREVHIRANARKDDRGRIEIRGRLRAVVEVLCSRCLEPVEETLDEDLFLLAVAGDGEAAAADPAREEDQPEDDVVFPVAEGRIDWNRIAVEQIYLGLARKPVCSENCRGLCPDCGLNRNMAECRCSRDTLDPRLAPLLKFRKN